MSGESPLSRWISETKIRSGLPGQGGERYGTRGRHGHGGEHQGGNDDRGETYYSRWTSKRITPVVEPELVAPPEIVTEPTRELPIIKCKTCWSDATKGGFCLKHQPHEAVTRGWFSSPPPSDMFRNAKPGQVASAIDWLVSEATRGPQWESRPTAVRNLEAIRRHPQRRFSLPHSAESVSEHTLENSRETQ